MLENCTILHHVKFEPVKESDLPTTHLKSYGPMHNSFVSLKSVNGDDDTLWTQISNDAVTAIVDVVYNEMGEKLTFGEFIFIKGNVSLTSESKHSPFSHNSLVEYDSLGYTTTMLNDVNISKSPFGVNLRLSLISAYPRVVDNFDVKLIVCFK
jgi:hypothetical protein